MAGIGRWADGQMGRWTLFNLERRQDERYLNLIGISPCPSFMLAFCSLAISNN
jgi:hypothetical protein